MKKLLIKLLLTPVDSDCNMACGYCYNGSYRKPHTNSSKLMTMDTIYKIFDQIKPLLKGNHLVVIWHGGEPLLAGKDFYIEAIKVQKRAADNKYQITNCIQTNGTLVDESWADLIAELKIGPSASVDGPSVLHNKMRVFYNGESTYVSAMRGYRLFQARDINTGMLIVISKANVQYPELIWNWILEQQIPHFDFLPCIEPERFREGNPLFSLTTNEVAEFSIRLFDLWFNHKDPNIKIRTFRDAIKGQIGGKVNIFSWKAGCLQHVSFDALGNAFPCARYHCYPETKLGNIQQQSFVEIMQSMVTQRVHREISDGQERCKNCKWNPICGSGCPFLKYALYGSWNSPYIHCQSRQALFRHVRDSIFKDNN